MPLAGVVGIALFCGMPSGVSPTLPKPRRAILKDLPGLLRLETLAFELERRDSPQVWRNSLKNPRHEVWVVDLADQLAAAWCLRRHRRSARLTSIAVDPVWHGRGLGTHGLNHSIRRSRALGLRRLTLEVDASRPALLEWYLRKGFRRERVLPHYYGPGLTAWKLALITPSLSHG